MVIEVLVWDCPACSKPTDGIMLGRPGEPRSKWWPCGCDLTIHQKTTARIPVFHPELNVT